MSLKSKVFLILLSVFVLYGMVDFGIQRFTIFPSFLSLERDEAIKNSKRSVQAIQREIHHLDLLCHDWAAWDDTYEFVESLSSDYIESNLVISSFTDNSLNLVYICNKDGNIVWGEIHDLETEAMINLDSFSKDGFKKTHPLISYQIADKPLGDVTIAGVLMTEQGPMLISSRPILNSDNEGPVRGSVIMGRFLNENIVKMIADQTQVDLQVFPIQDDLLPEPIKDIPNRFSDKSPYLIEKMGDDYLDIYTTFPDIKGNAALLIKSKIPRKIAAKGYATIRYALLSLLAAGLCVLIVMLLLLQRTVLKPITKLTDYTLSVGKTGDLSTRLSMQRRDEIGALAREFDRMMEQLSEARSKLIEQSYYSGLAEMASGILHNARNTLSPMVGQISAIQDKINDAPLDNIKRAVAELEAGSLDHEREESLNQYLKLGSSQMAALIQETGNQLKDISGYVAQIENILAEQDKFSHFEKALEPLHLGKILSEAATMMPQELQGAVSIEIDPGMSQLPTILAERVVLIQVFINLFNNAKESILRTANPAGQIRVNGEVERDDGVEVIHVRIQDNGEGIDADTLKRIFDRGFSNKKSKPSGNGLHWCGNILSAMSGRLYAESDGIGRGACFHLKIPVNQ